MALYMEGLTKPYATYIKTVLGKLHVMVVNHITRQPEGIILYGNPKEKNNEDCIVDTWSMDEDNYFKRANRRYLETGTIISYLRKEKVQSDTEKINSMSEEEMTAVLKQKFFTLKNVVDKMTSIAPIFRLLELAKEMEKSEKIIKFLEGKLAEMQLAEYPSEET